MWLRVAFCRSSGQLMWTMDIFGFEWSSSTLIKLEIWNIEQAFIQSLWIKLANLTDNFYLVSLWKWGSLFFGWFRDTFGLEDERFHEKWPKCLGQNCKHESRSEMFWPVESLKWKWTDSWNLQKLISKIVLRYWLVDFTWMFSFSNFDRWKLDLWRHISVHLLRQLHCRWN